MDCVAFTIFLFSASGYVIIPNDNGEIVELETFPVPYNNVLLEANISGIATTEWKNISGKSIILLCNISSTTVNIDMTCSLNDAEKASVIISAPAQYFNDPGRNYYWVHNPPLFAPVMELKMSDYQLLLSMCESSNNTLNTSVTPTGTNMWIETFNSGGFIFFQVFVSLFCLFNLALAGYNFYKSNWRNRFPQIIHICLLFESLGNFFRLLWFSVDPLTSRFIFPPSFSNILQTISFPICMAASLLVGLFWHQLLQRRKLPSTILTSNLKKVFFITILVLTLVEISCIICFIIFPRSSPTLNLIIAGTTVSYMACALGIFPFYVYTGFRIVFYLKSDPSGSGGSQRKLRLKRIMYLVFTTSILMFLMIVTAIMWTIPSIANTLVGFLVLWILELLELNLLSIFQILAFLPRRQVKTTSSSNTVSIPATETSSAHPIE